VKDGEHKIVLTTTGAADSDNTTLTIPLSTNNDNLNRHKKSKRPKRPGHRK